ncbi:hypothetical protein [Cohnella rhizosphaerae]|uniref:Uncharacterized protein n=1 Tax=Cohnella rhizosphaerae TaxID=1457232 RepID=A0A9X4KR46_9BACL|nr:hypothetical protein [Cohnella rhizosphaerae]MDG0808681.1 hypothetical protein [Cohnella rhizosphaerae]
MNTAAVPKSEPTSYGLEHLFENEALTDRRPSRILYLLYKDHWIKLFWSAFFFSDQALAGLRAADRHRQPDQHGDQTG